MLHLCFPVKFDLAKLRRMCKNKEEKKRQNMCGITGFLSQEENKKEIIRKMTNKIAHRGPDGEGYYIEKEIALGHRRLAIVDIKNGAQPRKSKNLVITFNGEIYNYQKLRAKLKQKGYHFKSDTDTEVLLYGYEAWGKELPKKLRGMFAFAIWDTKNKTLFCARDHFGMKPFYYYKNNEVFMFGSEIKSFLEHPKFKKKLNQKAINLYLSFSFNPMNETFFKDVYHLEPGNILIFQKNQIIIEPYYSVSFSKNKKEDRELEDSISHIIQQAVKCHTRSKVEIGAFLSSGVDSSYLVSLAKPNKTYTVGYSNLQYSEIDYAKELSNALKINNFQQKITQSCYQKAVKEMLYYMDEPLADASAVSLYLLAKLASKEVKVVLSGEGADEFFGGYHTYKDELSFKFYQKIPFFIRNKIAILFSKFPEFKGRNFIVRRGTKLEDRYVGVNPIFTQKELAKVLCYVPSIKNNQITKPIFQKYQKENNLRKMQGLDIHFWLAKSILLKADKMTMANSIEARMPFVDKEVFKLASTLEIKHKITKETTKIILRKVAKKVIPTKAYQKEKKGFPVPLREWIKKEELYQEIKRTISQEFVKTYFHQDYLLKLLEQHKSNKKDNYKKIWAIYCFIKWYEIYFFKG